MKNILITGSNGFLAKNLAKKLNLFFNVYGIGRCSKSEIKKNNKIYVKNYNCLINSENLFRFKVKFDYIIHCAGTGLGETPKKSYKNNVTTIKSIMEFVAKKNPNILVIFMSTLAVYGNNRNLTLSENLVLNPISVYAKNKITAEKVCIKFFNKSKIKTLIIRSGPIFGPGLKRQFIYDACKKVSINNFFFYSSRDVVRDWLFIEDMCDLILKVLIKGFKKTMIINLGSGKGTRLIDVINFIKKRFNKKNYLPIFNGKGFSTNPLRMVANIKRARTFGWKPKINFYKGLDLYIKWYKKNA